MSFIEEDIKEQEKQEEYERARKRAMYLLGSRDYSTMTLKEKLLNNYSEETVLKVLEDMKRYGFLDDERYGKKLASSLINGKKYGLYRVKAEMKRKGVPSDITESVLSQYRQEDSEELLKQLILKKYSHKLSDISDRQKLTAALVRKGYSFSQIKKAVKELLEENFQDEEFEEFEDNYDNSDYFNSSESD